MYTKLRFFLNENLNHREKLIHKYSSNPPPIKEQLCKSTSKGNNQIEPK